MEKFMVLDGNSLIHRAFHALPLLSNRQGVFTNGVLGFTTMLFKLLKQEKPDYIAVAFDEGKTFRHEEFAGYKGHRKATPNELGPQFPLVKSILEALNIRIVSLPGFEADDIIGALTKMAEEEGLRNIVVTGDRDSLQLVSDTTRVFITKKGISEIQAYDLDLITKEYGIKPRQLIDVKALMGDKSDDIPGIPGVGEKTALKLIKQFGTLEKVMENLECVSPAKLQDKLRQYEDQVWLSYRLAEIKRNLNLEFKIKDCRLSNPDHKQLLEIFEKLEFRRLTKEVLEELKNNAEGEVESEETPEFRVPKNPEEFKAFVEGLMLEGASPASVYILFEGQSYRTEKVKYMAIGNRSSICVLDFEAVLFWEGTKDILKGLFTGECRLIFHDGKRAMSALAKNGIIVSADYGDSMLAAYLLNSSAPEYSLQQLSLEYLGKTIIEPEDPFSVCAIYAQAILSLYPVLTDKLKDVGLYELYSNVELPLEQVLLEMESNGISLNQSILNEMSNELSEEIEKITNEIFNLAGESFNLNSPRQLGEILFSKLGLPSGKKTKTGYSTSAAVLEQLSGKHPIIDKILLHRHLVKLKSTYVDGLDNLVDKDTGRIHTTFNQTTTATGRLSSTEPNLQNIPIRMEMGRKIRKVFVPGKKDNVLLAADYSQIELRVLAHLSGDNNLKQAFFEHQDIHSRTASEVFGVDLKDVGPDMRRMAKAVNFGIVYGISDFGLSRDLGITRKEAAAFIDKYYDRYPGVKQYMEKTIAQAREQGYVTTILNRRRYLPDLFSSNRNVRNFGERTAMNTPIQGSAADIIKLAMLGVDREIRARGLNVSIVLQVHDELIFELPEAELEKAAAMIKFCMENAYELNVPLEVDMKYGRNWYEMESINL